MDNPTVKKPRNKLRIIIWGALLVVVICFLSLLILLLLDRRRLNQRYAKEKERWLACQPVVPDEQNRYFAYKEVDNLLSAAKKAGLGSHELKLRWISDFDSSHYAWPNDDAALRAVLARRRALADAVVAASRLPEYALPHEFIDSAPKPMPIPNLLDRGYLVGMTVLQGWADIRDGRRLEGTEALIAAVRMSSDITRGGSLMHAMIGCALIQYSVVPVFSESAMPDWNPGELRTLADGLQVEANRFCPLDESYQNELLCSMLYMKNEGGFFETLGFANYEGRMQEIIETLHLPNPEKLEGLEELEKALMKDNESFFWRNNPFHFMAQHSLPASHQASLAYDGNIACLRVAVAALRLQAARIETGSYPASMADLAAADHRAVLLDPFDEQPLCIRLLPEGCAIVYSIGQNGKDEGGNNFSPIDLRPMMVVDPASGKPAPLPPAVPSAQRHPPGDDISITLRPPKK
jgi:hypothetical protein